VPEPAPAVPAVTGVGRFTGSVEAWKRGDLGQVAMWQHCFGLDYALIAAMSFGILGGD